MRRSWAVGILTIALVGLQVATPAFAGGELARGGKSDATIVGEKAIISHADGVQQIDLLLDVSSSASEAGLVFPTPSPAKLSKGDVADFDALERLIVPKPTYVDDWWGFARSDDGDGEPEILDTVEIGPLEATTLRASNTGELRSWLRANDFVLPVKVSRLLKSYVDRDWSFVAVKLTSAAGLDGIIDPVRMTFESKNIVYPMRLSAGSADARDLRLYLLGDNRMDARELPSRRHLNAARETVWSGPVVDTAIAQRGSHLTVIDLRWDDPSAQVSSDIAIVDVATQDRVTPRNIIVIRQVSLLGIPVGLLISGWLVIGLLIFFGALVARTRIR